MRLLFRGYVRVDYKLTRMGIIINRFAVGFSVCGEGYMYARLFLRIQAFNLGDGIFVHK
jgi:hypothetical protein